MDGPVSAFIYSLSGDIARRATSTSTVGTSSIGLLYLFLAFQLVDQILLPILIATFLLSTTVKRHPILVNMCMTWVITGIVSSLLWYAGKHVGPEPPKMLCVSQASLLDGVLPMLAFVVLLYTHLNHRMHRRNSVAVLALMFQLLIAPYVTFFSFATSAAFLAVKTPETVNRARRFFYCSFESPISNVYAVFSALSLLTALGFAVAISVFLRRNWRDLRQAGTLDMHFLARVGVFGVYVFLSLVLSVTSIVAPKSPFPDLFAASVGTALSLILGTQPDIWRAWLGRSKPVPPRIAFNWVSSDMESPKAHDMESSTHDMELEEEDTYVAKDLSSVKDPGAEHVIASFPQEGSRRRLSNAGTNSDFKLKSGRDAGDRVAPYRFARPGMI
ncbi:hypothetical protein JB92DRAFT_3201413 [Gautieria morchelliformis]|nr:hypothetical protein JB92DRAFT_3201413 [Gautieria morchelliformis]